MNIIVRTAKLSDLKSLQDLNAGLFKYDRTKDKLLNHRWPYEEGKNYMEKVIAGNNGKAVCFVAEVNGKIVGYLAGAIRPHESWRTIKIETELENMFILEKYRRKGVGSKLVNQFFKWSKKKNATHVLVTTNIKNSHAVNFYLKNSFNKYSLTLEAELKNLH